jgi:hypothetical protein
MDSQNITNLNHLFGVLLRSTSEQRTLANNSIVEVGWGVLPAVKRRHVGRYVFSGFWPIRRGSNQDHGA